MKIVFDSNIIIADFSMTGAKYMLLEWFLAKHESVLVIPQIVIDEVKNKYSEMVHGQFEKIKSSLNAINKLLPEKLDMPISNDDLNEVCKSYEEILEKRMSDLKAERPKHDDIPQKDIVKRDLSRRRPFRKTGKDKRDSKDGSKGGSTGYRDTLLWEVILRKVAHAEDIVVFITSNTRDFGGSKGNELHSHLIEDLKLNKLKPDSVKLCKNLWVFIAEYVKPKLSIAEEAMMAFRLGKYKGFSIKSWFNDNSTKIIEQMDIRSLSHQIHYEIDNSSINWIEAWEEDFSLNDVLELDDNHLFIYTDVLSNSNISFYLLSPACWEFFEDPLLDISIEELDDTYGAWFSADIKVPIELYLIFNIKDEEVEHFNTHFLEFYGWCKNCGYPYLSDAAETCAKCGK